jgi:hypothetical protein
MIEQERRLSVRKPLERLAYISLPFNNGGIVLDVSEGGLCFHAIAPVEANGPIPFRFAVDSSKRIKAVGELAWRDETGKTGGLRFLELPDEMRQYIREWTGEARAKAVDVALAEPLIAEAAAPQNEILAAPQAELAIANSALSPEGAPLQENELAPAADQHAAPEPGGLEQAANPELDPPGDIGWTPSWEIPEVQEEADLAATTDEESSRPLLYNLRSPVYSSPAYGLSMFSQDAESDARAALAAARGPFVTRHPIAALLLTIFLASVIGSGIFAYVSSTQAGDVLYYLGEKAWEGLHPRTAPKPTPQSQDSAQDSIKSSER